MKKQKVKYRPKGKPLMKFKEGELITYALLELARMGKGIYSR